MAGFLGRLIACFAFELACCSLTAGAPCCPLPCKKATVPMHPQEAFQAEDSSLGLPPDFMPKGMPLTETVSMRQNMMMNCKGIAFAYTEDVMLPDISLATGELS